MVDVSSKETTQRKALAVGEIILNAESVFVKSTNISSCKDLERCAQKTLAPLFANRLAVASPIPDDPPVTRATLLLKLLI